MWSTKYVLKESRNKYTVPNYLWHKPQIRQKKNNNVISKQGINYIILRAIGKSSCIVDLSLGTTGYLWLDMTLWDQQQRWGWDLYLAHRNILNEYHIVEPCFECFLVENAA